MTKRDLVTTRGLDREYVEGIVKRARGMEPIAAGRTKAGLLEGKILATLFFEPSTRTQLSFQSAMLRLGGGCIGISGAGTSSVAKGETISDTMKLVESCADAIAIRHPLEGTARMAADSAGVPVINAGDGANEHPTQAILDIYTMLKEKGDIDGLSVTMAGDLKFGRTVHSLLRLLALYGADVTLYSPPSLRMPADLVNEARAAVRVKETDDLDLSGADVVYATRIQKERFPTLEEYHRQKYAITRAHTDAMKPDAILMHPLPKTGEIEAGIEADPRAAFYRQEANGVPVRMAILAGMMAEGG